MSYSDFPILSIITYLPLMGIAVIFFLKKEERGLIQRVAFAFALVDFLISVPLYFTFNAATHEMQFVEMFPWIAEFGISYHMGIDGISLPLVLLTTFLSALALLSTWTAVTEKVKEYMITILLLETGMIGVFCALDFFLFFIFWEVMLIPMYFIIGIWGGPRRVYAAIKFFIYTMSGSGLMLIAILALYYIRYKMTGTYSFDILDYHQLRLAPEAQFWLFWAFFLAFAIKVPMFPFHTWLPDAHVEAPTAGSVILAGVLLKMGTYGFLRFSLPIFPQASVDFTPFMIILSIIGIIYGALLSLAQDDIKKLVAYSSVSHLGFCMLGMFALNAIGMQGSILQMVNHGLSTGALFLIVGMLYERRHTRLIADYGGLWKVMPVFSLVFLLVCFSSMGVPGTNGFVGELLIMIGAFKFNVVYGAISTIGLILGAIYLMYMYRRVILGAVTHEENKRLPDLNFREYAYIIPILVCIVWIGVYPKPLLDKMEVSVVHLLAQVKVGSYEQSAVADERRVTENRPAASVPVLAKSAPAANQSPLRSEDSIDRPKAGGERDQAFCGCGQSGDAVAGTHYCCLLPIGGRYAASGEAPIESEETDVD
jgi:NADH-quinone oxidoreductase subunit M